MWPGGVNDVTHRKRGLRFEKKQWVEFLPWKKKDDFRSSLSGAARGGGQMEKSA